MKVFIDAILGGMYMVSTESQGTVYRLQDGSNNPVFFQCLEQIKHYFKDELLDEVWLSRDSLIDEFLGGISHGSVKLNWT